MTTLLKGNRKLHKFNQKEKAEPLTISGLPLKAVSLSETLSLYPQVDSSRLFSFIKLCLPLRSIIKMAALPIFHLRNGHGIHRFSSPTALPHTPQISKVAVYGGQMQGDRKGCLDPQIPRGKQGCVSRINIFLCNLIR